jgi:class III poly(R)-hydroxyalkanoic acid synthase PhaE subunit
MSKTSPWAEALELWWQALSGSIPKTNQPIFKKFFDQGKNYFRLNEEFMKVFQDLFTDETIKNNETLLWEKGFATLRENFNHLLQTKSNKTVDFWELPLENWRQTISLLTNLSNNLFSPSATEAFNSIQPVYEKFLQLLSVPHANLPQKWPEILEERTRLWRDYQQAQEQYVVLFNKIGLHTIDLLHDKIMKMRQQGEQITQLRAVYDLWIDCGEEAYAQFARTDEYSQTNARLINTWMAWRQYEYQQLDEILAALNIPTRQEMDKMSYRLQQLGRELKTQRNGINEKLVAELYKEINLLKAEVAQLKQNPKPASHPRRSTRKKVVSQPMTEPISPQSTATNLNDDTPPTGGK